MASFRPALAVSLALLLSGVAHAQPAVATSKAPAGPAAPIKAYDLPQIEAFGRAIYRQDIAAWLASDALGDKVPDLKAAGLKGWLVEDDGKTAKVRFLRDRGEGLEIGYDVVVDGKGAGPVTEPADRKLTEEERLTFAARQAAIAVQPRTCRAGYNTAIVKDPDGDGFIVWLLAPAPAAGAIPVGGHYRIFVAADGKTVKRVDALSASCLLLEKPKAAQGQPAMAFASHIVSPTPVETHVFLSSLYKMPLAVGANGGEDVWIVDQGKIRKTNLGKK
ncbi:hypothetical protein CFHF_21520 [Caulobacter flavus]|uniref:Uncharacterized protein n=1 Tax=Caulobacter flavus TaxID=1679497 RepID=A0A2N5CMZ0_9CAUL|nr:hypothetical protein [Caulobacter flavus]AYV46577.1 hypothetical protein C1707_10045 [Caulobacter flavus]PLR07813.1 hypothetical protein CFHF_21520 [Caulobacter flavus]